LGGKAAQRTMGPKAAQEHADTKTSQFGDIITWL
jgi:hypothetical protein